jgi:3-hydroxyisobutyrate dehydrogenase-like beta-hydroxyacid dehydrogenase
MTSIAFLGTGLLGAGFAEAAAGRGDAVSVWNRTAAKAAPLAAFGATVAATPAEAVRGAERVHLVLRDDDSVEEVIAACREALAPDAIIVDHTTTLPSRTAARAARLEAEGVRYLHCPVFVGPAAARQGKGTILCSGRRDLYDAVEPALARQAERVRYLGARADLAAVHKLAGNAFNMGMTALIADALAVGKGAGVASAELLDTLALSNSANVVAGRGRAMVEGNFAPSFELAMALKDLRLMLEVAEGERLAVLPGFVARLEELHAQGHAHDDFAVMGRDSVTRGS